jgi:carboxymethylenebutenolidase
LPDLFFKEGALPERDLELARKRRMIFDEAKSVDHVITAIDWLRTRPDVSSQVVGSVGFCMGGTIVLDLAALAPNTANVCYYGFPAKPAAAATNPEFRYAPVPLDLVDRMRGPLLGFWGDQDHGVGMDNVQALGAALNERGVEHDFEIYPGLGHGFLAASRLDPESEIYDKACDAWSRTLAFYRKHLS